MITVHHLKYSQSFRIVWLLEELYSDSNGDEAVLPRYKLQLYERLPNLLAPPEYKAISPLGTAPCVTIEMNDDNNNIKKSDATVSTTAIHLGESNAIIDYILDMVEMSQLPGVTSALRPKAMDASTRQDYLFWFHTCAGSFQPILTIDSIFRHLPNQAFWPISAILRLVQTKMYSTYIEPKVKSILQLAENQLSSKEYLAGSVFTAADITAVYSFDTVFARFPSLQKDYPHSYGWFQRMQQRPAFQRALQKVQQTSIALEV